MKKRPPSIEAAYIMNLIIDRGDYEFVKERVLGGYSLQDSHAKGKSWEAEFMELTAAHGYEVIGAGNSEPHDKLVNDLKTQCKFTDYSSSNRTAISRMRNAVTHEGSPVRGTRAYHIDEVDVVALRCSDGLWIWPSIVLADKHGFIRKAVIPAQWGSYRDAWHVFGEPKKSTNRQMKLF